MVQPLNVGSIPTGPTYGKGRLQPHPGDVLKKLQKSLRSGLNLEGRLSDPQFLQAGGYVVLTHPRETGNPARQPSQVGRLFEKSHIAADDGKRWKSMAEGQDKSGIAILHQLLCQLQAHFGLGTLVGLHPLLAPATFSTAWICVAQRMGWGRDDTGKGLLIILSKSTKVQQCKYLLTCATSRPNKTWVIHLQCLDFPASSVAG